MSHRPHVTIILFGFLLTSGCMANRPALTCPDAGGPPWYEIKTPHFTVETDLSQSKGEKLAIDLYSVALIRIHGRTIASCFAPG